MAEGDRTIVPAVSVVMPMYNAAAYVEDAVRSILEQTFTDLELVIVDDGSTDGSAAVVGGFTDPRIRVVSQTNQGIVAALNNGLAHARAPLIARHDADDVAAPERLAEQVAFLAAHPEVGLLGTWARVTDAEGQSTGILHHPTGHAAITYALLFDSALVHPSVVFRRSVLDAAGTYEADAHTFEDHDLWCRMARVTRVANIPHELVQYRVLPVSASRVADRTERLIEQRRRNFRQAVPGIAPDLLELIAHTGIRHSRITWRQLRAVRNILFGLIERSGTTTAERTFMLADARMRLLDFHLVQRRGNLTRLLDRAGKSVAIVLPTFGSRA